MKAMVFHKEVLIPGSCFPCLEMTSFAPYLKAHQPSVRPIDELNAEIFQESLHTLLSDSSDRLTIDARCPFVSLNAFPCFPQNVTSVDAII